MIQQSRGNEKTSSCRGIILVRNEQIHSIRPQKKKIRIGDQVLYNVVRK